MKAVSPFATSRFEYEARHVYYLPQDVFAELEDAKPTYLIGSRGTGKTTLLKALSWDERLENASLRSQLRGDPFQKHYIGVYLKAPEFQLGELDAWLKPLSKNTYGSVLGYFFDLLWIELLSNAVAELIIRGVIEVTPEREHKVMDEIAAAVDDVLSPYLPAKRPYTLCGLAKACRKASTEWQRIAKIRPSSTELVNRVPAGQAGEFGRVASKFLGRLCDGDSPGKWHFKVCIDESETLQPDQQIVINTMVRLAQYPLFPVVSFVSLPQDFTNTLIPGLTLQKADRHLKILDDMSDKQFRDLAQGVARVRVSHCLKRPQVRFDLDRLLGHWNANALLEPMLRDSARSDAADLLEHAQRLSEEPFFDGKEFEEDRIGGNGKKHRVLPIYQAYLIDRLRLSIPSPQDKRWKRRGQDSAELRKRMVAAFLSICQEFGMEVRYASGEAVLQLSDKCARDFLAQMEAIYRASAKSISDFLELRIPYADQFGPLRDASLKKSKSLVKFGVRAPTDTGRLVDGLARITTIVQTSGPNFQHLKSSERGVFQLDIQEAHQRGFTAHFKLIVDASEAGFLRIYAPDGKRLEFRVHTSLAAAYGFSYRGAYYPLRLAWTDVERLINAQAEDEHNRAVSDIGRRLSGQEADDLPLFSRTVSSLNSD